jgi:alpha-beta hydrolase superfamily lysophospholipase
VEVPGAQGLTLKGTYYPAAEAPVPGVLLLHMYGRNRADWADFARRLQSAGVASLAIDLRGHGETREDEDWELAQQDVLSAHAWLASQAGVAAERTGVVGASIGANLALWLGAEEPGLDAVALLSPGFEYFRVRIEGLIERYGDRPVFLAASQDDRYSADTVQALATAASGPAELVVYETAGHGTDMFAAEPDLADRVLDFLQASLAP